MPPRRRSAALLETEIPMTASVSEEPGQEAGTGRRGRLGRRAAGRLIEATQTGAVPDVTIIDAKDVNEPSDISELALPQKAGRLALQDATPALAAEQGSMVHISDFEGIYKRFQTPIITFIFHMVSNREEAFDLAQDVFVKAFRSLSADAEIQQGALSSWLYRIASNTATDALRRRRLINWIPLSIFDGDRGVGAGVPSSSPFDQSRVNRAPTNTASISSISTNNHSGSRFEDRLADREMVERVLCLLPDKYRSTLLLYEHEGFSVAEVADILKVKPSAIKMRLMRARERFIALYTRESGETPGQVFVRRPPAKKTKQAVPVLAIG